MSVQRPDEPRPTAPYPHPLEELLRDFDVSPTNTRRPDDLPRWVVLIGRTTPRQLLIEVVEEALRLNKLTAAVFHTAIGIELGEASRSGSWGPIPELSERLRTTSQEAGRQLRRLRAVARLLRNYESLPIFVGLLGQVWMPGHAAARCGQEELSPLYEDGVSDPPIFDAFAPHFKEPAVAPTWELADHLQCNRRPTVPDIRVPGGIRPRPYAEGMKRVWSLTAKLGPAVDRLGRRLGRVAQSAYLAALMESDNGAEIGASKEVGEEVRYGGTAATALIERLSRGSAILSEFKGMSDENGPGRSRKN